MKLYLFIFSFVLSVLLTTTITHQAMAIEGVVVTGESQTIDFFSDKPLVRKSRTRSLIQPSFPKLSFGQHNKYFTDIITLQYQISLLQTLIERQRQDQEIRRSFADMGIPYMPSAPKKTVCQELPVNDLCVMYYKDLYGDVADKTASMGANVDPNATLQSIIDSMPSKSTSQGTTTSQNTGQGSVAEKKKEKVFDPPYKWADIACINGLCRATLIKNGSERLTVNIGSMLIEDDITVENISFNNVTLANPKGEKKRLRPAASPDQGGVASPILGVASPNKSSESSNQGRDFDPTDPFGNNSLEDEFDDDVDVDVLLDELSEEDSTSDILILSQ